MSFSAVARFSGTIVKVIIHSNSIERANDLRLSNVNIYPVKAILLGKRLAETVTPPSPIKCEGRFDLESVKRLFWIVGKVEEIA
ncbi:8095_t:CDS:2 [Funneliformis mosseae]|uniref:8095_t:CDS:1 n=1 Tax=Funneliformis mosseae TaxID=27381 RepID=A0A9N9NA28_FUNMO|nr:8095_t:CDS:2 [Funneliformis mosseae]